MAARDLAVRARQCLTRRRTDDAPRAREGAPWEAPRPRHQAVIEGWLPTAEARRTLTRRYPQASLSQTTRASLVVVMMVRADPDAVTLVASPCRRVYRITSAA